MTTYAVVQIGGHQYKVMPGQYLDVQKMPGNKGDSIKLEQVLFVGGETPLIGSPVIKGAFVTASIHDHGKAKKEIVFKRRPGFYKKKKGHRQPYTCLKIGEIKGV